MEVTKDYKIAYVQVLEILKKLNKEEFNKIPKEKIELYEDNKDNNYQFELNNTQELEEQINPLTKCIVSNLFIKYIASDKDRKEIYEKEKKEYVQKGMESRKELIINPLFNQKEKNNNNNYENALIIKKDKSIFEKILDKIRKFFTRR